MFDNTKYVNATVLVCGTALLGACGGGGGGSDDGVATSSAPVTISAANAPQVAAAAYKTTAGLEGGGSGATGFLTGAVTQTSAGSIDVLDVLLSQVKMAPQLASSHAPTSLTGVVVSETVPCTSGSMTITLNDSDNNQQLSTGDSFSFTANNCSQEGMSTNGSVTIDNVFVSGNILSPPYSMQLRIQANNYTISEGVESVGLNGSMTLAESTTDGVLFTHSITGSSIQVTEGSEIASLSSFNIEASEDNNTLAYTLNLNATVNSPELGGYVTIVTGGVFQGFGQDYPSSGEATITGANDGRITLIALNSLDVRLEIDEDGDGAAETVIDTTWAAL